VKEDFCYGLDDYQKVEGCYRHLTDYLPLLANLYLKLAEVSGENLLWFDDDINNFHIVLGGDGAPFGKDSTACTWFISFINRGKSILSNTENFMIFGLTVKKTQLLLCAT
jgi:hypothetical protein